MNELIIGIIASIIPTMAVFLMQRGIRRRDEEREKKAEAVRRDRNEKDRVYMKYHSNALKATMAALALGEANAIAIRDQKCNGETAKALAYAEKIKNEQKDFLHEQGIEHIIT